ncbi:alpha/beta fold hydrolase [Acidipila sp. EB88]|uniref:alpha/beta fold hydrolase n=1 Tax=Acidipila sp. EB88 TaxID=2305226 RepID=UPI0013158DEF|nr:alpha/beta hydrolase [Acidipila sp. EB88]
MLPLTDLAAQTDTAPGAEQPTLVLLHFYGSSRREWIEAGALLHRHFRVISIDTPGFGEAREVPGYSVSEMADTISETITALKPGRFVLVGHSMTGKIAAVLAKRGLPGLAKLVLLTPSPVGPEPIDPEARARMLAQAEPTRADAEEYVLTNSSRKLAPAIFERAVEDRLQANPEAWRSWMNVGSKEDWSERVTGLSIETLVIAAADDVSLGPNVQRELTMPHFLNVKLETVPQCGHLVPMEAPHELAELIKKFAEK